MSIVRTEADYAIYRDPKGNLYLKFKPLENCLNKTFNSVLKALIKSTGYSKSHLSNISEVEEFLKKKIFS